MLWDWEAPLRLPFGRRTYGFSGLSSRPCSRLAGASRVYPDSAWATTKAATSQNEAYIRQCITYTRMYLWYHAPTVSRTYGITYLRGQTSVCPSPLSALGAARMGDPSAAARFIGRPERGVLRQWVWRAYASRLQVLLGLPVSLGGPSAASCASGVRRASARRLQVLLGLPVWAARARRPAPARSRALWPVTLRARGPAHLQMNGPSMASCADERQWGPAGFCPSPQSALGAARMGGPSAASCASKVQGALACNSACSWASPFERPEHGIMCR